VHCQIEEYNNNNNKKKKNFFYLRTSTINGNFRGLPGAVDRTSIDDIVVG
jgi:hypothetical protein